MKMGSLRPPYMNTKDCSQGFCSLNCPQWCYLIFPPPPPLMTSSSSSSSFSPLVIAIIGILASAFLLVSYYAVISKICGARSHATWPNIDDVENNHNINDHVDQNELWNARSAGLDEALIKLISVKVYKKGKSVFSSTDCSVCLGEFEEGEPLRVLPKCSHAFHVCCIDKWLKTHTSCPLCRSNIQPGMLMHQEERMEEEGGEEQESNIVEMRDEAEMRSSRRRSMSMDLSRERRIFIGAMDYEIEECKMHMKDQPLMEEETYRILHCVKRYDVMKRSMSSGRFLFTRRERVRNSSVHV